jgi:TonB-linked SusC/RagA family outer membrane protein
MKIVLLLFYRAPAIALFFLIPMFYSTTASAQQSATTVKGIVHTANNNPIPNVSVIIRNNKTNFTTGTKTDTSGIFTANVPVGGPYSFSFSSVGYQLTTMSGYQLKAGSIFTLDVSLKATAVEMDQVVVIGYGTAKRRDVTGAIAGINEKDIKSRPVDDALQAMQGKVAGVDITTSERPGTLGNITIRGVRSLTASNSPLFVVDGIPLTTGGIDNINPSDIESIDILKDASATAIYGSRGANGVVIVSTKKGKAGRITLSLNSATSIEHLVDKSVTMNAAEYIDFRRWAYYYSNPSAYPRGDQPTMANDQKIFLATSDPASWANIAKGWAGGTWDPSKVASTDWKGMVTQTGITTNNTLSVSGGTDKVKAYASFGYLNNKGTVKGQDYTRYTVASNIDITPAKWFSMGSNMSLAYSVQEYGQSAAGANTTFGNPSSSLYGSARGVFEWAVPYDSTGNRILYPGGDLGIKTVADEWKYSQDQRVTFRAFGSFYTQLDLGSIFPVLKGLKYRMNFGPDLSLYRDGVYIDQQSVISIGSNRAILSKSQTFSYTLDNLLYYDKAIGKSSFGVTLLESQTKYNTEGNSIDAIGIPFSSQKWNALTNANIPSSNLNSYNSYLTQTQLLSYMGRVNYNYDDKYFLTVSARSDGASQLAEGHKYSLFPSTALAWRLSNEGFLKGVNWVNDLKLRVGVGATGNSAIDAYATQGAITPIFYPIGSTLEAGSIPSTVLANQLLGWEKTTQYNVGIDYSIFNRRVYGSVDVYTSQTRDLLMQRSVPTVTGYRTTYANIGQTANKGVDVTINSTNIQSRRFQWTTTLNASWQKDRIVSLSNGKQNDINNGWFIGQPIGVIYGYQNAGLWDVGDSLEMAKFNANGSKFTAGNVRPVDQNGDYKIDANNDRVIIGNTRPRWIVGMTNTFTYKGIELSIFLYGRLKYIYNTGGENEDGRFNQREIDYYTENNQNAEYQKPIYSTASGDIYSSSLGYKDGSFIKVRNISLGYTFNNQYVKIKGISNLRVYVQVANPGMLYSKITWIDPDTQGGIYNRGVTFGVNADF